LRNETRQQKNNFTCHTGSTKTKNRVLHAFSSDLGHENFSVIFQIPAMKPLG
jgi:hypothetical protein